MSGPATGHVVWGAMADKYNGRMPVPNPQKWAIRRLLAK